MVTSAIPFNSEPEYKFRFRFSIRIVRRLLTARTLPAYIQGVRSLGYMFLIVIYKHTFFRWRRNETHFYANNIISNSLKDLALTRTQSGSFEHVFGPTNATRMRKYYKYSKFLYVKSDCDVRLLNGENQVHTRLNDKLITFIEKYTYIYRKIVSCV